jgi:uncharacterized membrane protein
VFNSAEYLFISNRLAHFYADLRIAKMILGFQTPWPKQSYQHITDTSKKYDRKFSALQRSLSIVVLFFLTSLSVPISVQYMIIQCGSTVTIGYTVLFHLRLYQIFPVLIVVPTIFLGVIIHFMIQSNKSKKKVEDIKLMKEIKTMETEKKNAYQAEEEDKKNKSTPLEAAIVGLQKKQTQNDEEERIAGLTKYKKRRESLQKGIKIAQQIETVLQKVQEKKKEQINDNESLHTLSEDFLLSNESSSISKHENNDYEFSSTSSEEKKSDDKISFPGFSVRKAFAYLAQRFTAEVEEEDDTDPGDCSLSDDYDDDIDDDEDDYDTNDDNDNAAVDDDDDLFNLHLAKETKETDSKHDSYEDDEMSSDDSILDELKSQAVMKLVSLSNTSLASMVLLDQSGFDRRRKSYEVPPSPVQEMAFSEGDDEEDFDDNLSSIHLPPVYTRR